MLDITDGIEIEYHNADTTSPLYLRFKCACGETLRIRPQKTYQCKCGKKYCVGVRLFEV